MTMKQALIATALTMALTGQAAAIGWSPSLIGTAIWRTQPTTIVTVTMPLGPEVPYVDPVTGFPFQTKEECQQALPAAEARLTKLHIYTHQFFRSPRHPSQPRFLVKFTITLECKAI